MSKERKIISKKLGTTLGILIAITLIISAISIYVDMNEVEMEWREVARIDSSNFIVGENDPGESASGWLATFMLDYAETPATCLASNASGGGYDTWGNVSGYVDYDGDGNPAVDLPSENGAYFVVRCRFNDQVKSGGNFQGSRCRVRLTVSGDETISALAHVGDNTNTSGGGIVSQNNSADDWIWINFYWDDNSDGYRILDDGTLEWSIIVEARY
jgi:hypothetical protein